MASPDMIELWPVTWKETRKKASGIINTLQTKVAAEPLEPIELSELNSVISHIRGPWNRPWGNPLLARSMKVIRQHFYLRLSLEPPSKLKIGSRRILENTVPVGYFKNRDPEDPELNALVKLSIFHDAMRRKEEPGLDFTTLINPAYKPGPVGL